MNPKMQNNQCSTCQPPPEGSELAQIVDSLCAANCELARNPRQNTCRQVLPSRETLIAIVEDLRTVLFPGYFGNSEINDDSMRFHVGATLDRIMRALQVQIKRGFCFECNQEVPTCDECELLAGKTTKDFMAALPRVRAFLATDVTAAYEDDPAATCPDEAILCYPGILAITNYRLAHELYRLNVPLIPRIISEHAHSITGIDIHPGASIGERFFIDHGTGIVIGETSRIGSNVRLYQGVTLGAKSFPLDANGQPIKGIARHPLIEDDVIIYAGATILGRITVGHHSVIGGNVWLTESVAPGSRVTQAHVTQEHFSHGEGI